MSIRPPIFLGEAGQPPPRNDLAAYATEDEAVRWDEWIDVENDEYVAYDSEGRLLTLSVDPPVW